MDNTDRIGLHPRDAAGALAEVTPGDPDTAPRGRQRRGFAVMDPALQRELASRGGRASHAKKRGHEWSRDEAREAGRKGGKASRGGRGRTAEGSGGGG
jgi:general stress protein YciG